MSSNTIATPRHLSTGWQPRRLLEAFLSSLSLMIPFDEHVDQHGGDAMCRVQFSVRSLSIEGPFCKAGNWHRIPSAARPVPRLWPPQSVSRQQRSKAEVWPSHIRWWICANAVWWVLNGNSENVAENMSPFSRFAIRLRRALRPQPAGRARCSKLGGSGGQLPAGFLRALYSPLQQTFTQSIVRYHWLELCRGGWNEDPRIHVPRAMPRTTYDAERWRTRANEARAQASRCTPGSKRQLLEIAAASRSCQSSLKARIELTRRLITQLKIASGTRNGTSGARSRTTPGKRACHQAA